MSPILIAYLVTVAIAFPLIVAAWWDNDDTDEQIFAVFLAVLGCGAGPLVLLAFAGIAFAQHEPRHLRHAREAAEAAELHAREAKAIADRERALGL